MSSEVSPAMQEIGVLNLRIRDMMTQLNLVMNALIEENAALKEKTKSMS